MTLAGIDIGGTQIKAGLVDESGHVLASSSVPTPAALPAFRDALLTLIAKLACDSPAAVGIGCKGIINPETTRVEALPGTLSYLEGSLLSDLVAAAIPPGTPVAADNDARAAMAGEFAWGAAKGRQHALMLTLGTGVGGGVVADGRLLRGATGVAGHLGHVTVDPDGPPCICGSHGCLETIFSARAIEAEAFAVAHRGCASRLTALHEQNALTCEAVFQAAFDGDALARRIVDRATRALGAALAGLIHVFDPEIVIVGGQIAEAGEPLFAALRREVAWRTQRLLRRQVPIIPPRLKTHSGIAGAAALGTVTDFRRRRTADHGVAPAENR